MPLAAANACTGDSVGAKPRPAGRERELRALMGSIAAASAARYRALVHSTARPAIMDVRMLALDENRVVVRTEATQLCYTIVNQSARSYPIRSPRLPRFGTRT